MSDRDDFEAWARDYMMAVVDRRDDGEYVMLSTSDMWQAWQAARRWRPIEEAPKDGTRILVCGGGYHCDEVSCEISSAELVEPEIAEWYEGRFESPHNGNVWFSPTRFQYLSEPPNE